MLYIWRIVCLFSCRTVRAILRVCSFCICVCTGGFWRFWHLPLKVKFTCQTFSADARVYFRIDRLQTLSINNLMDPLPTKHHLLVGENHRRMLLNLIVSSFKNGLLLLNRSTARLYASLVILSNHSNSSFDHILLLYGILIIESLLLTFSALHWFIAATLWSLFKS